MEESYKLPSGVIGGRHFSCDCGDPRHSLYAGPFYGHEFTCAPVPGEIWFTLVVEPDGLWERLKAAVAVLRGRYNLHEIVIDRDQWPEFVAHINALDAACRSWDGAGGGGNHRVSAGPVTTQTSDSNGRQSRCPK